MGYNKGFPEIIKEYIFIDMIIRVEQIYKNYSNEVGLVRQRYIDFEDIPEVEVLRYEDKVEIVLHGYDVESGMCESFYMEFDGNSEYIIRYGERCEILRGADVMGAYMKIMNLLVYCRLEDI